MSKNAIPTLVAGKSKAQAQPVTTIVNLYIVEADFPIGNTSPLLALDHEKVL
jgi:hypothetical protein